MGNKILPRDKELNSRSRNLRKNATKQENHLWYDLLKDQEQQFYRQRVIGEYIAIGFSWCFGRDTGGQSSVRYADSSFASGALVVAQRDLMEL
jgi:hypothetical protein